MTIFVGPWEDDPAADCTPVLAARAVRAPAAARGGELSWHQYWFRPQRHARPRTGDRA
jgi:hypothetical protein